MRVVEALQLCLLRLLFHASVILNAGVVFRHLLLAEAAFIAGSTEHEDIFEPGSDGVGFVILFLDGFIGEAFFLNQAFVFEFDFRIGLFSTRSV